MRRILILLGCLLGGMMLLVPSLALAQSVNIDMGQQGGAGATARLVQLTALIGLLSLAPSLLVMATAFGRIIIVLSLLRSAIGAQGVPPNPVLIGLALFLTWFVMEPVIQQSWTQGVEPLNNGQMDLATAVPAMAEPFRQFMAARVDPDTFAALRDLRPGETAPPDRAPFSLLTPAFVLSELARAFQIGFLIFLPFLIIDLVVAAVLMAMGMMMVPPAIVSLPFKLAFFVVADGWTLISGALVRSYLS